MLARRAAAEVLAREKDRRALEARLVEHELAVLAPFGEKAFAEAGALDRSEVLLRDDLVGIDVRAVERHHHPVQHGELHHLRMSTKWPAIAAAAAITGLTRCVRPPAP